MLLGRSRATADNTDFETATKAKKDYIPEERNYTQEQIAQKTLNGIELIKHKEWNFEYIDNKGVRKK